MRKLLAIGLAIASMATAIAPAHASVLSKLHDIVEEFEHHCTIGRTSASCAISHTKTTDLPDTTVPAGATTAHGPVWGDECGPFAVDISMPGGKVFCVADYTSYMFKNASPSYVIDGGVAKFCETKTVTFTYVGLKLDYGKSTADGACVR